MVSLGWRILLGTLLVLSHFLSPNKTKILKESLELLHTPPDCASF